MPDTALAHAESRAAGRVPSVLFLCVHNAGRSQMALGWFTHLAGQTIEEIRPIRDKIRDRVTDLLQRLNVQ